MTEFFNNQRKKKTGKWHHLRQEEEDRLRAGGKKKKKRKAVTSDLEEEDVVDLGGDDQGDDQSLPQRFTAKQPISIVGTDEHGNTTAMAHGVVLDDYPDPAKLPPSNYAATDTGYWKRVKITATVRGWDETELGAGVVFGAYCNPLKRKARRVAALARVNALEGFFIWHEYCVARHAPAPKQASSGKSNGKQSGKSNGKQSGKNTSGKADLRR
jgi:hypothetical protein